MPGHASWKVLYEEEYNQLFEEGYPVGKKLERGGKEEYLPIQAEILKQIKVKDSTEDYWEEAYHKLWAVREKGLRKDYPFHEPNDFSEITQETIVPELNPLDRETYSERIKGAWYGRCGAVVLGKPLEVGFSRKKIREYLESVDAYPLNDWVPASSPRLNQAVREDCIPSTKGNVAYVQPDDDIQYTILALMLFESKGDKFSALDVGTNWLDNIPYHWVWCSARQMYYHLVNSEVNNPTQEEVLQMVSTINPWRECIDGQIRTDFWGYINPTDPLAAAKLAHQECVFGLVKNGLYGGMFVAGCIAGALSAHPTIDLILDCGMSVIPKTSRLYLAIENVRSWYEDAKDWEEVCEKIEGAYGHLPFAATINNIAIVVLALVHGKLDYEKTITTAVMCGIDTDCNSATAGSIVGAAIGYNNLGQRFIAPLNDRVKTVIAGYGEGTITDLVRRTIVVRESRINGADILKEEQQ